MKRKQLLFKEAVCKNNMSLIQIIFGAVLFTMLCIIIALLTTR